MAVKSEAKRATRLVRTRQNGRQHVASRHGILRPQAEGSHFRLERFEPAEDLRFLVHRHWSVQWDLRGRDPYQQETLPHPCVNLAVQPGQSAVYGIGKRRFTVMLEGEGQVVGTKFRPGMFAPLMNAPIVGLTGRALPLAELFGVDAAHGLERAVLATRNLQEKVLLLEEFLRARVREPDEEMVLAMRATELVLDCQDIKTVEELAVRFHVSVRTLQRCFRRCVGVTPKWVIQRARLQEAAEQVSGGEDVNWARLASELGYFDQSHLIKDFRAQVGQSPAAYAASCARSAEKSVPSRGADG